MGLRSSKVLRASRSIPSPEGRLQRSGCATRRTRSLTVAAPMGLRWYGGVFNGTDERLCRCRGVYVGEPAVRVLARAVDHAEEFVLQPLGDRAAAPVANRNAVDRTDRRDLGGGAAEEN